MIKIKPYHIWLLFSTIFLIVLALIFINKPFRGDERHIVETIRLFANELNLNTLKNYQEVTPPFFYLFYSFWAKIFGASIESLRILTLIIAFTTWQLIYFFFNSFAKKDSHSFLLSLVVIINPYMFGTSTFVFTDMLTILLSLAAMISYLKDKVLFFTIFCILSILSRQYAVIIPLAVILLSLLNFHKEKHKSTKYIFYSVLSFLPLLSFFLFWGSIAPVQGIEKWVIPNSAAFNIDYINTYITFSVIYVLPIIILFFTKIKINFSILIFSILVTALLSVFPVNASNATLQLTDFKTVGIVHQVFATVLGLESLELKILLFFLLLAGCYVNMEILKRFYELRHSICENRDLIVTILWFLFLLIMPFSYQVWEKYLTMILPFLILSIYLLLYPAKSK